MPRIIAAMYADHTRAESALSALAQEGIARNRIAIIGQNGVREASTLTGFGQVLQREAPPATLYDFDLPEADTRLFEDGLRRGYVVIVAGIDTEDAEKAVAVVDMFDPVDLGRPVAAWTGDGAPQAAPRGTLVSGGPAAGEGVTNTSALPGMGELSPGLGLMAEQEAGSGPDADLAAEMAARIRPDATDQVSGMGNVTSSPPATAFSTPVGDVSTNPDLNSYEFRSGSDHLTRAEVASKMAPNPSTEPNVSDPDPNLQGRLRDRAGRVRTYERR